jgi:NADH:ubiquinone oxidoreductase subunit 4 (subunit M)
MHTLLSGLRDAGPQWVMLLVCSPLIGAAMVAVLGRTRGDAAQPAATANRWLTIALSLIVAAVFLTQSDGGQSLSAVLPWLVIDQSTTNAEPRLFAVGVLSLGVDRLNLGPLMVIPWLTVIAFPRPSTQSISATTLSLLLESVLLALFAAHDAVTFLTAELLALGLIGLQIGWHGRGDRRIAASRFWRGQFTAHVLWCLGLIGLACAAAWSRQELLARIPPIDFRWLTLARGLPQVVSQSIAGFHYWHAASPLLFAMFITGGLLRGPWPPFHRGLRSLCDAVPRDAMPLVLGGWPLIAGYAWLRFIEPAFGDHTAAISRGLAWWTATAAVVAAGWCWFSPSLRQFTAAWWLGLQSLGWMGLVVGSPVGQTAGWLMLQAAAWSAIGWSIIAEVDSGAAPHRRPWSALLAAIGVVPIFTIPIWGGDPEYASPIRTLLVLQLEPTALAVVAWFLIGWAAVRRIVGLLLRHRRSVDSSAEGSPDMTVQEFCGALPLMGCVIVVIAIPSIWWGSP